MPGKKDEHLLLSGIQACDARSVGQDRAKGIWKEK
jgi:hypothetical protein